VFLPGLQRPTGGGWMQVLKSFQDAIFDLRGFGQDGYLRSITQVIILHNSSQLVLNPLSTDAVSPRRNLETRELAFTLYTVG
jgi:hypothetical protein